MPDDEAVQDRVFAEGEGDRWFRRNRVALAGESRLHDDLLLRLLEIAGIRPARVVEIGGSNGYRLHELHNRLGCEVTSVDPSDEAIEDGRRRHPAVRFLRGVAAEIPAAAAAFDLVIVNFVFHWIDRSTLLRSVAEIDRVLADGGYLAIGDFYPPYPERVPYHHLPAADVATYKQSYGDVFVASGIYEEAAALVFDHATQQISPGAAPAERARVCLLRKSLQGRYARQVVP
jgi:SAM-dependent methyltransferase